ncbi:MAG TPA: GNAT family N-acetyltransferase [Gaiellaceae bacterium]
MHARELTVEEAERPLGWRYPEPYATYDATGPLGRDRGFFAVDDDGGELVGFGCTGFEARVPGVEEEAGTVDVGYGMRPELVGRGLGREFVGAVVAHAAEADPTARLRLSILRWNDRSRRVAEAHGFRVVGRAGEFDVLVREPPRRDDGEEYRPA